MSNLAETTDSITASNENAQADGRESVPYESFSFPETHAAHLYVVAKLFDLSPKPAQESKILEIGCAQGCNLIAQALLYPNARFVGIDLSRAHIDQANKAKQELDLTNIGFRLCDVADLTTRMRKQRGTFDYIICHGVLSWLPPPAQDDLFAACRDMLTDNGIAVFGYNTLPGWNHVRSLREMMLYHSERFDETAQKIAQSKALLHFLSENVGDESHYKDTIDEEIRLLEGVNSSFLLHDHLEAENHQFYLHEFVHKAQDFGLAYVGDSSLTAMYLGNMPQAVREKLHALDDLVTQEQYMDFLTNRRFRDSIVTKTTDKPKRALKAESIFDFYVSAHFIRDRDASKDGAAVFAHKTARTTFTVNNPQAAEVFIQLCEYISHPVKLGDLIQKICAQNNISTSDPLKKTIQEYGLELALRGFLSLHADPDDHISEISEKPRAFPLARYQARQPQCAACVNAAGETIPLDIASRTLLPLLDGAHNTDRLVQEICDKAQKGELTFKQDDSLLDDSKVIEKIALQLVQTQLRYLADNKFLIG